MADQSACLLCGHELEPNRLSVRSSAGFDDGWDIECAICGRCSVTMEAELEIRKLSERERADLASWVREQTIQKRKPPTICSSDYEGSDSTANYRVNQILENLIPRDMAERLDRILANLAAMTGEPGERCSLTTYDIYACCSVSEHQMRFLLDALAERGWVRIIGSAPSLQVTPSGWIRVGELSSQSAKPAQAFVAMNFTDDLEPAWKDGIYKGVRAVGYRPVRVDKQEHNEKICDRIISEIRRSGFVVADVTNHRQGVYFEAGYAMGLGIPVIWTCRKDQLGACHFDTRQYNHIVWGTPAELAEALEYRIRATIGETPKQRRD